MVSRRNGAQTVALFASALALASCGTQVGDDPPSVVVGPTTPTDDETTVTTVTPDAGTAAPTATGPAATGTTDPATGTGTGTTDAGGEATGPTETETQTSAEEAGTEDAPSVLPGFEPADAELRQEAAGEAQLIIDDVRLGLHDDYDRVVLDLSGTGEVGWIVRYVDEPGLDGSGAPVDLAGDVVLQVVAQGMAYPEPGDTAYDPGLLLVDGGELQQVTEVLRGAPFEGQVQVFVGTEEEAPFRVFRLSGPERLVIDIQH
jgi:hypothetical protein